MIRAAADCGLHRDGGFDAALSGKLVVFCVERQVRLMGQQLFRVSHEGTDKLCLSLLRFSLCHSGRRRSVCAVAISFEVSSV